MLLHSFRTTTSQEKEKRRQMRSVPSNIALPSCFECVSLVSFEATDTPNNPSVKLSLLSFLVLFNHRRFCCALAQISPRCAHNFIKDHACVFSNSGGCGRRKEEETIEDPATPQHQTKGKNRISRAHFALQRPPAGRLPIDGVAVACIEGARVYTAAANHHVVRSKQTTT